MADVLFKKVNCTLKKLIENIHVSENGLPDIQCPFVWPRDLVDSMYRGFPIEACAQIPPVCSSFPSLPDGPRDQKVLNSNIVDIVEIADLKNEV